jgi:hypothetical protein
MMSAQRRENLRRHADDIIGDNPMVKHVAWP